MHLQRCMLHFRFPIGTRRLAIEAHDHPAVGKSAREFAKTEGKQPWVAGGYCLLCGKQAHTSHFSSKVHFLRIGFGSAMPNGYAFDAHCQRCGVWARCHRRHEEDVLYWPGVFCEMCLDWIVEDCHDRERQAEVARIASRARCIARAPHLKNLIAVPEILRLVAHMASDKAWIW